MLTLLLLLACQPGPPAAEAQPAADARPAGELHLDVLAQVVAPGSPAAWSAVATVGGGDERRLLPGECVPASPRSGAPPSVIRSMGLDGALEASLIEEPDAWRTAGGLRTLDPAWRVADLVWSTGDAVGARRIARAVRFGPSPEVREIDAEPSGIRLRWNPLSVEDGELALTSTSGELRCGIGSAGVVLPSWVQATVPEVRLRSVHETVEQATAGLQVRVRAIIERVVPFAVTPAEVAPSALPPARLGPSLGPIRGGRVQTPRA